MTIKQESASGHFPGQFSRALHLFALVQIAIAYPVYDLLSRNPEFFVARQSQPIDIGLLVLLLSVGLPLILYGLQAILSGINHHLGRAGHLLLIALLFLLLGSSLSQSHLDGLAQQLFSLALGLALTVIYWRFSVGRLFVSFLSPAIILVPALFMLNEDLTKLMQPVKSQSLPRQSAKPATASLIFVIFDELPTYALLDDAGNIDADLFPNFHALVSSANWYPNATTVATSTILAIPAIVTGQYPTRFAMPHQGEFPDNLFTWLANDYALNVHESVSVLCSAALCDKRYLPPTAERLHDLLLDVSAIYLNIVAADLLHGQLPVITQSWEDFWGAMEPEARLYEHRLQQLDAFTARIRPSEKPGLHFIHANFPHIPYEYLPSGKRYQQGWLMPGLDFASNTWTGTKLQSLQAYQRFLLQLEAVDAWLGRLISKLKAEGIFEESLIVLTSDHGVSFTPGTSRRDASPEENLDITIMPVPLIIKLPHQQQGLVSERNAESIDIMPTLADSLDRPLGWTVDGVSLLAEPKPVEKHIVHGYKDLVPYISDVDRVALSSRSRPEWAHSAYWADSYQELIGQQVTSLPVQQNTELVVRIDHAAYFESVDPDGGFLPAHISGSIQWPKHDGADVVIALNGHVATITTTYEANNEWRFSAMLPEPLFRAGVNNIKVFGVKADDIGRLVLIPASAAASGETYSFNTDDNSIVKPGGNLPNDPSGIEGSVDYISFGEEAVEILGWAIDSAKLRKVKAILVFDGDQLVYKGGTYMLRVQSNQFGVVIEVGFHLVIPFSQMIDDSGADLRIFAITEDDRTLELLRKD